MNAPFLIAGFLLIFFGRRLFWLFVGLVGFVAGFTFAQRMLQGQPPWVELLIAAAAGIIGVLLALFLQKLAVAVAGFFSGGYLGMLAAGQMTALPPRMDVWFFLIGGILGAILLMFFFEYALIFLSSVTGSTLIVRALPMESALMLVSFVALVAVGFVVQTSWMRHRARTLSTT